jgi:hypothetical protein
MNTAFNSWNYEGEFLQKYPRLAQGTVMNLFCYAFRDGARSVTAILQQVEYQARRRMGRNTSEHLTDEWLSVLVEDLLTDEAQNLASFVIWRESLPAEERQALKRTAETAHVAQHMQGQPPTAKQLKYLASLGCTTTPADKYEASRLIDQWLHEKQGAAA